MLVNRCSQLFAVYRISRSVPLLRSHLVRQPAKICVRSAQSQNATKLILEDIEQLKLNEDIKLYENIYSNRIWRLHLYSLGVFIMMGYTSVWLYWALEPSKDKRVTESWAVNYLLKAHDILCKWKIIICGLFVGLGVIQFFGMTLFIKRNVHSIVLLKNGREVILETYGQTPVVSHLVKHKKLLSEVSCLTGRNESVSNLFLAVSGLKHKLYIDKNGRFFSPELFDVTVGVKRKLKQ